MNRPCIVMTSSDHQKLSDLIAELRRKNNRIPETLQDLVAELNRAELRVPSEITPNIITMNSQVRVRDLESGESIEFTLVFPDEADTEEGRISILAPLGTAVLGYKTGDVFDWKVPAGIRKFQIEAVLYQPEHASKSGQITPVAQ